MSSLKSRVVTILGGDNVSDFQALVFVHFNLVAYSLAFWVMIPTLPYLIAEAVGEEKSSESYAYYQSLNSVMQLVGGPLMGRLADKYGPKFAISWTQLCSLMVYVCLALASKSPILIYVSIIPSMFQHIFLASQGAVALLARKQTSKAMGLLSFSYSIGMVFGSSVGGMITTNFGSNIPAYLAAGLSTLMLIANVLFLPNISKGVENNDEKKDEKKEGGSGFDLLKIFTVFLEPPIRNVIIPATLVNIGLNSYRSVFISDAKKVFHLESQELGFFISFSAAISFITNIALVPYFTIKGESLALGTSLLGLAISYIFMSFCRNFQQVLLITVFSGIFQTVIYVVVSALLAKLPKQDEIATAVSLSHASRSLTGVIAPICGVFISESKLFFGGGLAGVSVFVSVSCFVALLYYGIFTYPSLLTALAKPSSLVFSEKTKSE